APEIVKAHERSCLAEKRRGGATRGHPGVLMAAALDLSDDVQPPVLLRCRLVAQALERNANFNLVPGSGEMPLRIEHEVGAEIGERTAAADAAEMIALLRALDYRAVHLHAERVDAEHRRLPSVIERRQQNLDPVVVLDAVARRECRADRAR